MCIVSQYSTVNPQKTEKVMVEILDMYMVGHEKHATISHYSSRISLSFLYYLSLIGNKNVYCTNEI